MNPLLVVLTTGQIQLAPIRRRDGAQWRELRRRNNGWLDRWEATSPLGQVDVPATFAAMVRGLRAEAKAGRTIPWVIMFRGELAGQLTIGGISYGSLRSANAGYWVGQEFAGRGIAPTALAMATDHCWRALALHRMEVNIRPENQASLRVVEKLGFRYEGLRRSYLHIEGKWCDHLSFALTAEEVPGGLLRRWYDSR